MYEKKILLGFIRVHILHHALIDNGIYGLEMIEELKSHGYRISPGTLYPILHDMQNNNLLNFKKENVCGKIRKIYTITKKGEETLKNLKKFIQELSEEVI
jgi:PadR family transcriptional regulator, regulatory protein PadR